MAQCRAQGTAQQPEQYARVGKYLWPIITADNSDPYRQKVIFELAENLKGLNWTQDWYVILGGQIDQFMQCFDRTFERLHRAAHLLKRLVRFTRHEGQIQRGSM